MRVKINIASENVFKKAFKIKPLLPKVTSSGNWCQGLPNIEVLNLSKKERKQCVIINHPVTLQIPLVKENKQDILAKE